MRHAWVSILVLAGCPQKHAGGPAAVAGPGCPAASGVYVASYVTQDAQKGRSGWVVPLQAMQVNAGANTPEYTELDAAAASASGVPAAPSGTLWLVTAAGAPCRATVGKFYAARVDGPPASLTYGIELDGCAAPTDPQEGGGIVMVSEQAPTGCRFEGPQPVAARLGEMDAQKMWQRPTKETPIPASVAAVVPVHDCKAPGCETLWAVGEIKVEGKTAAWAAAVNWLQVGDPSAQCSWKAERWSGFLVPDANGTAQPVSEGLEHPLVLSAALADSGGAKVLLAEGPGEYATYDLAGTGARLGHHITWMLAPPEAWEAVDHLGPICP